MRKFWDKEFSAGDSHYGFLKNTIPRADERQDLADFFFWTAWAAGTNRPDLDYSYTNNWPSDRTVGSTASTEALLTSLASIMALFTVLGIVVYVVHRWGFFYGESTAVEAAYRLLETPVTPSQRASAKFFLIAGLLVCGPDLQRRPVGPLHGASRQVLRELHRRDVSVQLGQELAPATGDPLDCRLLDGNRCLPRAPGRQARTTGAAAVGQHPLRGSRGRDGGQPAGRSAGNQGLPGASVVLARSPGMGVSRTGTSLADPALRRPDLLAGGRVPGDGSDPEEGRHGRRHAAH